MEGQQQLFDDSEWVTVTVPDEGVTEPGRVFDVPPALSFEQVMDVLVPLWESYQSGCSTEFAVPITGVEVTHSPDKVSVLLRSW